MKAKRSHKQSKPTPKLVGVYERHPFLAKEYKDRKIKNQTPHASTLTLQYVPRAIGKKRVECMNRCGNTVQLPEAICRDCKRLARRRMLKMKNRVAPSTSYQTRKRS